MACWIKLLIRGRTKVHRPPPQSSHVGTSQFMDHCLASRVNKRTEYNNYFNFKTRPKYLAPAMEVPNSFLAPKSQLRPLQSASPNISQRLLPAALYVDSLQFLNPCQVDAENLMQRT
ncbi:hypothetical protein PoB_007715900 [Plakobranchus ocellatus]|uniref:Uncharacterized protein n=1 Tax=Plakobranchus ocellatus TaxID=259542 RepID=A0AAV4E3C8_9GAST|nr:hypothetical protein PoB_007715900 [Plakobranchus ocellatus]